MEKELTVESELKNLPVIGEFIDETMRCFGIDDVKDIYAVKLSVDEACTNIIKHSYSNKQAGKIVVHCMLTEKGEKFVVQIMDWGEAFDPIALPAPDTQSGLTERKEGGLGVFFMKKFMDEVTYRRSDNMNLLIIAKHIKK
ncbi:MAG: ATP-binding protein [Candidatus Bathyarchaeota archaeon]|nr:ATP-binding protein [Candidatus Bathyarchaeota archaeon]